MVREGSPSSFARDMTDVYVHSIYNHGHGRGHKHGHGQGMALNGTKYDMIVINLQAMIGGRITDMMI